MRRLPLVLLLLALAAIANADGAMGLALEAFDFKIWAVYVAATVLFEAWYIGKGLQLRWHKSLLLSFVANALAAFCCVSEFYAPFLHGSITGTRLNPDPLLDTILILTVMAFFSAAFEFFIWYAAARKEGGTQNEVGKLSLKAHLWGVPLALAILLIPLHPYQGLNRRASYERRLLLVTRGKVILGEDILQTHRVPTLAEFTEAVARANPEGRLLFYAGDYERFDMGEHRRSPLRVYWNPEVAGKNLSDISQQQFLIGRIDTAGRPIEFWVVSHDGDTASVENVPNPASG